MGQRVADTGVLTGVALGIILAMAVLVVLGILWGARLKRQRTAAEAEEQTRMDEAPAAPGSGADGDAPAIGSVEDQGSTPPATTNPGERSPATQSARADAIETPEEAGKTAPEPESTEPAREPAAIPPAAPAPSRSTEEPAGSAAPVTDATADPANGAVTLLKGLGPKVAARLAELGITTIGQLAALDAGEAERLDVQLGAFTGRLSRDRWVDQARFLAAGDTKGFEAVFGRL